MVAGVFLKPGRMPWCHLWQSGRGPILVVVPILLLLKLVLLLAYQL